LSLENLNYLYECWVFCKIFQEIVDLSGIKFREVLREEGVTFESTDKRILISYQRTYQTGWEDQSGSQVNDRPDISIEFNDLKIVVDAKNSDLDRHGPYPYREEMDSYISSSGASTGLLIFSKSASAVWNNITRENQKIYWTSLIPGHSEKNRQILKEISKLIMNQA
jgi:hypothetical protein